MKLSAPQGGKFQCPHCGVEYRVIFSQTPTRDSGSAYCKNCRLKMSEWNDFEQPVFPAIALCGYDD
jgi:transcription elongation factor Elf1